MIEKFKYLLNRISFGFAKKKTLYALLIVLFFTVGGAGAFFYDQKLDQKKSQEQNISALESVVNPETTAEPQSTPVVSATDGSSQTSGKKKTGTSGSSSGSSPSSSTGASSSGTSSSGSSDTDSGTSGGESTPETPSAVVAFYADSQTDENPVGEQANHQRVVNYILQTSANPVFHAGDLLEDGTDVSWDYFNSATATLRSTRSFYAAPGNNERNSQENYFDHFSFPGNEHWYSVNVGNLHMVILDSAYNASNPDQLSWLQSDLQSAASQSRITGVMYHHPETFSGLEGSILQYLIDYNVDFIMTGHTHTYRHTTKSGIHYFTTTGQPSIGYFLAKIYSDTATFQFYDSSNNLYETINFTER